MPSPFSGAVHIHILATLQAPPVLEAALSLDAMSIGRLGPLKTENGDAMQLWKSRCSAGSQKSLPLRKCTCKTEHCQGETKIKRGADSMAGRFRRVILGKKLHPFLSWSDHLSCKPDLLFLERKIITSKHSCQVSLPGAIILLGSVLYTRLWVLADYHPCIFIIIMLACLKMQRMKGLTDSISSLGISLQFFSTSPFNKLERVQTQSSPQPQAEFRGERRLGSHSLRWRPNAVAS